VNTKIRVKCVVKVCITLHSPTPSKKKWKFNSFSLYTSLKTHTHLVLQNTPFPPPSQYTPPSHHLHTTFTPPSHHLHTTFTQPSHHLLSTHHLLHLLIPETLWNVLGDPPPPPLIGCCGARCRFLIGGPRMFIKIAMGEGRGGMGCVCVCVCV